MLAAKRRIAARYAQAFAGVSGIVLPREANWARSSWLYTILRGAGEVRDGEP